MKIFDNIKNVDVPVLENGQVYIYVLENEPQHNIKIGRSSNMQQRIQSLSGSNSGGNHIIRCAISDATYLYTLEGILHNIYKEKRIQGTEWFEGEELSFFDVCTQVNSLFQTKDYIKCNTLRKNWIEQHNSKND